MVFVDFDSSEILSSMKVSISSPAAQGRDKFLFERLGLRIATILFLVHKKLNAYPFETNRFWKSICPNSLQNIWIDVCFIFLNSCSLKQQNYVKIYIK